MAPRRKLPEEDERFRAVTDFLRARLDGPAVDPTGQEPESAIMWDQRRTASPPGADEVPPLEAQSQEGPADLFPDSTVRLVPIDVIDLPGWNVRQHIEDTPAFDELVADLAAHGLLHPILVTLRPDVEGRYWLIAGERRLRAARTLGWEAIRATVLPWQSEQAFRVLVLTENLQRENLSLLEEAQGYEALMAMGFSIAQISRHVSKARSYIASVLRVARHPRLRALVEEQQMSGRFAREMARLVDGHTDTERVPGAIDAVARWVELNRPSFQALAAKITEVLETGQLPVVMTSIAPVRRTWAEREWARWERAQERMKRLPGPELAALAATYERMAQEARALLSTRESGAPTPTGPDRTGSVQER